MLPNRKPFKAQLNLNDVELIDTSTQYKEDGSDISTLRDICILLYAACGQGVSWNLAYELSKRLNVPYYKIALALDGIIEEYAKISFDEGFEKLVSKPKPSQKYFDEVERKAIEKAIARHDKAILE